jgi:drug/metabolite transporter (DMT)-like permease
MAGARRGAVTAALAAALLFGAAAPLLEPVVAHLPPLLVAGLLYTGAALAMLPLGRAAPGRRSRHAVRPQTMR